MPTEQKREQVAELAELLRGSSAVAVADYRGLRVSDIQAVRRSLRASGVSFRVVKNRLMSIAADEAGRPEIKPILGGPTAVAVTSGDEVALAKSVLDSLRPYSPVVNVRGGLLGTRVIDADAPTRLSTLPGLDVLLARVAGSMAPPLSGLAAVLAGNLRNMAGVLSALAEKKAQSPDGGTMATDTVSKDTILEAIDKMTVLELSELVKAFEERYGVTAAAPVAAAAAPAAGDGAAAAAPVEEQTEFNAVLTDVGPNKILVIKAVRELTGLGLKEAKDLVDAAPKAVKEAVPREEAEAVREKLAETGATVEVR